MGIKIIEINSDYFSLNYQFCKTGNPDIARYIRDEIVSQVIIDTTLSYNRWSTVPNRKNMLRSTGGLTLLVSSNKFIIQVSGEAFLFLDEFDIKDLLIRAGLSISKNRKFDLEQEMKIEMNESVGRIDSQVTISIPKSELDTFFSFDGFTHSGRDREFRHIIGGENVFTGRSWIKNKEIDVYKLSPDELKKCPQTEQQKRDFIRIYDKIIEVIDTTLPHSPKRHALIEKYAPFINSSDRIFRIEIQENDRDLSRHLKQILNTDLLTFKSISEARLAAFAKRNLFKMWSDLLGGPPKGPSPG